MVSHVRKLSKQSIKWRGSIINTGFMSVHVRGIVNDSLWNAKPHSLLLLLPSERLHCRRWKTIVEKWQNSETTHYYQTTIITQAFNIKHSCLEQRWSAITIVLTIINSLTQLYSIFCHDKKQNWKTENINKRNNRVCFLQTSRHRPSFIHWLAI